MCVCVCVCALYLFPISISAQSESVPISAKIFPVAHFNQLNEQYIYMDIITFSLLTI